MTSANVSVAVPQASVAVGVANAGEVEHSIVVGPGNAEMVGGVVSTTLIVWLQVSVPRQVRVTRKPLPQKPVRFVIVLTTVMVRFAPPQGSVAVGGVKVHAVPHSTTRSDAQMRLA